MPKLTGFGVLECEDCHAFIQSHGEFIAVVAKTKQMIRCRKQTVLFSLCTKCAIKRGLVSEGD